MVRGMARFAIVQNGKVVNLAVSETALEPGWFQSDVAQIGWSFDGQSFAPPPKDNSDAAISAERDRRIGSGLVFNGKTYDFDAASRSRISGMATLAGFAIGAGAQPGNLLWAGPNPFNWIASDNSFVPMDAQTCFALGQAAAAHEAAHIFAARAIKDAVPRPVDVTAPALWP
jgi:hypothetical protein